MSKYRISLEPRGDGFAIETDDGVAADIMRACIGSLEGSNKYLNKLFEHDMEDMGGYVEYIVTSVEKIDD